MQRPAPLEPLEGLWSQEAGLDDSAVAQRRARYGPNAILAERPTGWLEILRSTVKDPMIWFLVGTALLFLWLGDYTEAAVLAVALIPIAGMDVYLHRRTEASTEGLRARLASRARVVRNGVEREIQAADLVPGDLVIVPAGAYFPADGLILAGHALQADESTLTGEALPVRKLPLAAPPKGAADRLIDGVHWGMAGTRLLTGEARLRVALTGGDTYYGEIARLSSTTRSERTPLQAAITDLVRILLVIALVLCAALAVIRYVQGYGLVDAILSAVTLAIAALPEEFPVVFSFFLGLGVFRLAKLHALVRRAVVVENIGRVTCICTDKTGTLTEGRLLLSEVVPAGARDRAEVLAIGATASRAETADPLDEILLASGAAWDGAVEAVYPFTEDRLREVCVLRDPEGGWRVAMKGAPEMVLSLSDLAPEAREVWLHRTQTLAGSGHKVIAVAARRLAAWTGDEPEEGFDFAGLLAFSDPVRDGVAEAVAEAQGAGIRVIMITGDHARTAEAIAGELGIGGAAPRVVEGAALERRLGQPGPRFDFDVVARCTPAQKLALVEALRAEGELVAVTGDGVNDAPALRGADVGIAMGERGTRSAREVAAIVLLDDNFATLVRAVAEGRQLFTNLRLSFAYLLMLHAPLVATAALIPLMGYPLLYLPIHIVWIELIIHPTAMLVFQDLPSRHALTPGGERRLRFFSPAEWARIGLVGAVATAVILGGFVFNLGDDLDVPHARSMAMATLVIASAAMAAALTRLGTRAALLATVLPVVSAIAVIQIAPVAELFHLRPLHGIDWLLAAGGGALVSLSAAVLRRETGHRDP
ncbi:cation-translocating P-type ATPase [Jannaschia seohaensis]|uniref:Ca2+-transporting ATPase n=1 Tax=Jannaschia seohaensis TaxID=475081 RepID=A0A2Y8ZYJ6_9RHOB|nr:cation-transporting P-type ATPase [Jannaschia seohaensis]PWJ21626.1 Ca2+-transporting ATPase [Jannaschia seohaensis]SSA37421.1 Ca2+-transporting ATPase [Jannaschia seohaensis]